MNLFRSNQAMLKDLQCPVLLIHGRPGSPGFFFGELVDEIEDGTSTCGCEISFFPLTMASWGRLLNVCQTLLMCISSGCHL